MSHSISWKVIDTLRATVPGSGHGGSDERQEFIVKLGRDRSYRRRGSGIDLDRPEDPEQFSIENVALGIRVEASSLKEAKAMLRKLLEAKEDYSGTWTLWAKVEAGGGFGQSVYHGEQATATISVAYRLELTTKQNGKPDRVRHCAYKGELPSPFTGTFWVPTTAKELEALREGPAFQRKVRSYNKRADWGDARDEEAYTDNPEAWVEATPELVETIRLLQRRLGEMGEKVKQALAKERMQATLQAVRQGAMPMLGEGTAP